mgnify:CR=1 FL=1
MRCPRSMHSCAAAVHVHVGVHVISWQLDRVAITVERDAVEALIIEELDHALL